MRRAWLSASLLLAGPACADDRVTHYNDWAVSFEVTCLAGEFAIQKALTEGGDQEAAAFDPEAAADHAASTLDGIDGPTLLARAWAEQPPYDEAAQVVIPDYLNGTQTVGESVDRLRETLNACQEAQRYRLLRDRERARQP